MFPFERHRIPVEMFTFRWEDTAVPLIDDGEPALIIEQIPSSCAFYNEEHLKNIEI